MSKKNSDSNHLPKYFKGISGITVFCAGLSTFIDSSTLVLQISFLLLTGIWTLYNFMKWYNDTKHTGKSSKKVSRKVIISVIISLSTTLLFSFLFVCYALPWISCKFLTPTTDLTTNIKKSFKPVVNLPWSNYGTDFGTVPTWSKRGVTEIKSKLSQQFERLEKSGIDSMVWHLLADGRAAPEFDSTGTPIGFDNDFWNDYDEALKLAEAHNLGIFWVLLDYKWFNPKEKENNAILGGHANVITDKEKRKLFFEKILIPLVKRQYHNSNINGWILINEPENAIKEGYIKAETLKEFYIEASTIIKGITCKQRIAIGSIDIPSFIHYWSDLELDAVIFHHYEDYMPPPVHWLYTNYPKLKRKNIFNGEFFINQSSKELYRYLYWMRVLGYSGAWPWSVNAEFKKAFQVLATQYTNYTNEIEKKIKINSHFLSESTIDNKTDKDQVEMYNWWKGHLIEMRETITKKMAKYSLDLNTQSNAIEINKKWHEDIEDHIRKERQFLNESKKKLVDATQSVEEDQNWKDNATKRLRELEKQHETYLNELETIKKHMIDFDKEMELIYPKWNRISEELNSLEKVLIQAHSLNERQNTIDNFFEHLETSQYLSNDFLIILEQIKKHFIWKIEKQVALEKVNKNINIEKNNIKNAVEALKKSQSWLADKQQTINEFQQKIKSLEIEKARANLCINRCKALKEWYSFHIEFSSRFLNSFIPKELTRLDFIGHRN